MAYHKVSLDPYRRESRKIFRLIKQFFTSNFPDTPLVSIEKASVDETYIDLGPIVFQNLIKMFPVLNSLGPEDHLPSVPNLKDLLPEMKWNGIVIGSANHELQGEAVGYDLYNMDKSQSKNNSMKLDAPLEPKDWDDVALLIGSQIIYKLRKEIFQNLGYTCSAGISRVRSLSKLASGKFKPALQTIVRSSQIPYFLEDFELTDIGGLGGKLGDHIKTSLKLPTENSIKYIRESLTLEEMQKHISPQLAKKLKRLVEGSEHAPVNIRTDVKSMASVKHFTNFPLKTHKDVLEWLRVFSAELSNRVIELSDDEQSSKRLSFYPKAISVSFKNHADHVARQKQISFPLGVSRDNLRNEMFELSQSILKQMETHEIKKNRVLYPCEMISLDINGFINLETYYHDAETKSISSFFKPMSVRGIKEDDKKSIKETQHDEETIDFCKQELGSNNQDASTKINNFTEAQSSQKPTSLILDKKSLIPEREHKGLDTNPSRDDYNSDEDDNINVDWGMLEDLFVTGSNDTNGSVVTSVQCPRCHRDLKLTDIQEHKDWHFARDIHRAQKKGNTSLSTFFKSETTFKLAPLSESSTKNDSGKLELTRVPPKLNKTASKNPSNGQMSRSNKRAKIDKNQTFLKF